MLATASEETFLEAADDVVEAEGPFLTDTLDLLLLLGRWLVLLVEELDFFVEEVEVALVRDDDVLLDVFSCIGPVLDDFGLSAGSIFRAFLALATMPVLMDFTCKKRQEKIHSHGICIMVFCRYAVGQIAC